MSISENTVAEIFEGIVEHVNASGDNAEEQLRAVRTMKDLLSELEHSLLIAVVDERLNQEAERRVIR